MPLLHRVADLRPRWPVRRDHLDRSAGAEGLFRRNALHFACARFRGQDRKTDGLARSLTCFFLTVQGDDRFDLDGDNCPGNDPKPTADRACCPASPKTRRKDPTPLMTPDDPRSLVSHWTMPSSLTTRRTRERSPSASCRTASRLMPVSRAWLGIGDIDAARSHLAGMP